MMQSLKSRSASAAHDELSPFTVEFFWVQTIGHRCMAYLDYEGKWHEAFNGAEIPGPVRVLE